jgi:hypothetical protein
MDLGQFEVDYSGQIDRLSRNMKKGRSVAAPAPIFRVNRDA